MAILRRFKEILKKLGRILYHFKWWILDVVDIVFLLFSLLYPLDYYIEMPGGAYDIRNVLTVDNKEDDEDDSYNLMAVMVSQATLIRLVYAWLTPYTEISTTVDVTGGYSNADYLRINEYYMETSQNTATYQALTLAGKEVTLGYRGVYVLNVSDNSTFKGTLSIADTVTGVNGQTLNSSAELMAYAANLDLGSEVTIRYTSDGEAEEVTGKIIELSNKENGIRIGLVGHTSVSSDVDVGFDTSDVGDPSASLMLAFDIYNQLNSEGLRKGRRIVGTGTIESDGSVRDIGDAALKVVTTTKADADIFFVPNDPMDEGMLEKGPDARTNYEETVEAARDLDAGMKIVPVTTVQEAIDYLRNNDQNEIISANTEMFFVHSKLIFS